MPLGGYMAPAGVGTTVTAGELASGSVGPTTLASGAVVSGHIATCGVSSGNICSGQVGWPHLASGAVRSGHIGDAAVVSGSIASGHVGWPHLASGAIRSGHVGDAAVVSGSVASGQVTGFHFASGAVFSGHVGNAAVVSGSIASGQVTGFHLASGAVQSGHIGNTAVVSGSYASGQIASGHLASGLLTGLFGDSFPTVELVSGLKAVCLTSGAVFALADAASGLRLPAVGIVVENVASGATATSVRFGSVLSPLSGLAATWSGFAGRTLYVGSGGMVVGQSGLLSGMAWQRLGFATSGGILVQVDPTVLSGGYTVGVAGAPVF